jgi:hypothetical protein
MVRVNVIRYVMGVPAVQGLPTPMHWWHALDRPLGVVWSEARSRDEPAFP